MILYKRIIAKTIKKNLEFGKESYAMDEKDFEKKQHKKLVIAIITIVALLIVVAVAVLIYFNYIRKPERIFTKIIESTVEMPEQNEIKSSKIDLELSAQLETEDPEMKLINIYLKTISLKGTAEVDTDKKILNGNILATLNGEDIINLDVLMQNYNVYIFLNEIFDKYIEINENYINKTEIYRLFEAMEEETNKSLLEEVKQILKDEISSKEFTQEKAELDEKMVLKTTLKLKEKESLDIIIKVLKKINEYENNEELDITIEDLETEREYGETLGIVLNISTYTKGLNNNLLKMEFEVIDTKNKEQLSLSIEPNDENSGTITMKLSADEENTIILNIKYRNEYGIEIKERDASNCIDIDDITEQDAMEIYQNIQKNEILNEILQTYFVVDEESEFEETTESELLYEEET